MTIIKKLFVSALVLLSPLCAFAWSGDVSIETPNTVMLLHANEGNDLRMDYYGEKVADLNQLRESRVAFNYPALPAFGCVDMTHLHSLQIQHENGDLSLELSVTGYEKKTEGDAISHIFTMQDKLMPITVKVFYKAWQNVDVIETWVEIINGEKKSIILKRFDSGHLTLRKENVWITHCHGDWAAEFEPTQEPLTAGVKTIRNSDGTRNSHLDAPEIMLSLDGEPNEQTGRTIGAVLCWNGNFEIRINTNGNRQHHLYAGIDPHASEYVLDADKHFETPHLALSFSTEGMGGVSRNYHRWARNNGMFHRGNNTGDILLNSWEGIYFDITEERIINMMDDIANFGGELFVMDDGWFGDKYPRNNDTSSLGDWVVDVRKLPNGLKALTEAAKKRNIKFGIWIEPEMTNTKSELYEKHPDWVLQVKGRNLNQGRGGTQVVLDLCNPEVQDFVFSVVDNLMTQNPEIAYIKWDANAPIQNYGSTYLPKEKQNNIYIDYQLGLIKTLKRIREKYPDLVIQDCASGGGRANYGLLPFFDEFWVSDNNDALQRVFIQYGTSVFFPSNAMAQHIGGSPYGITQRAIPIKFRCDVAMSGRLGMELQPKHMNDEERKQCTTAIADYKGLRNVIQVGNLYRLISPYSRKGVSSLMYVNDNKSQAVLFIYKVENYQNQPIPRIRLNGLEEKKTYTLHERNVKVGSRPCYLDGKQFTGEFLMKVGIEVPLAGDYASRIFELE